MHLLTRNFVPIPKPKFHGLFMELPICRNPVQSNWDFSNQLEKYGHFLLSVPSTWMIQVLNYFTNFNQFKPEGTQGSTLHMCVQHVTPHMGLKKRDFTIWNVTLLSIKVGNGESTKVDYKICTYTEMVWYGEWCFYNKLFIVAQLVIIHMKM
jgi:hypothetical protein